MFFVVLRFADAIHAIWMQVASEEGIIVGLIMRGVIRGKIQNNYKNPRDN